MLSPTLYPTFPNPTDPPLDVNLPGWGRYALNPHARYVVMYGGRGGAKTQTVARLLVMMAAERPMRIAGVRERLNSIEESQMAALKKAIYDCGLGHLYTFTKTTIDCVNGSHFFFRGLSTMTENSIVGLEEVDIVWIEQAERMSDRSRDLLYPTVRAGGSQIWLTFNPINRTDPVWFDFLREGSARRKEAVIIKANYYDNPWFPDVLDKERIACELEQPEKYAHIWLGEPDDSGDNPSVLSYDQVKKCVEVWPKLPDVPGRIDAGLDVADKGLNCFVARRGPRILDVERWRGKDLGETTERAHKRCQVNAARRLYYDVTGVGAGVDPLMLRLGDRSYALMPVLFGGPVAGPTVFYSYRVRNNEFFSLRNAQLAWTLKLRAMNTERFLDGADVNPAKCLAINPEIEHLEDYLAELTQPVEKEGASGRMAIDKAPDDAPSPHRFDGTCLAFSADSERGLRVA